MERCKKKFEAGFTLVEVMVVIAIFGVLAALSWSGLSPTHHEYEVRSGANQLTMMFKSLRLRAISTASVHALGINLDNATVTLVAGVSEIDSNSWEAFQGDLPVHIATTRYGNERVLDPAAVKGLLPNPGYPIQALHRINSRAEKASAAQTLVDIFSISNCTCTSACGSCGVPAAWGGINPIWFLFYPDGSIRFRDAPWVDDTEFTIYFGLSQGVNNNYTVDPTKTTDSVQNIPNRWKVMIHRNTGRVKFMKGWVNTDV